MRSLFIVLLLVIIGGCDAVTLSLAQYLRVSNAARCPKRYDGVHLKIRPARKQGQQGATVINNWIPSIRGGFTDGKGSAEEATRESSPDDGHKQLSVDTRTVRHTSDVIRNILGRTEEMGDEEIALRELVDRRAKEYLAELGCSEKPPSPLKVLHYLAPKVPAIKHSPDFMLRIQTARGDFDSGIAATIISTIARLCIQYEKKTGESISKAIVMDRRFEQLVECVLCGVDVRRRKGEMQGLEEGDPSMQIDMEVLLDEEDMKIDDGLSVPDACRAAWGIGMLSGYRQHFFGGQRVIDILTALSVRTRNRLLARLQLLRRGELRSYTKSTTSLAEGFEHDTNDLAEDVASSMWTFACVKATTGLRTVPLFEASCSLLCQNPAQLRKREQAKKIGLDDNNFEVEEVVEKLAKSEDPTFPKYSSLETVSFDEVDDRDAMLHWLSPNQVAGIMWAVALHGRTNDSVSTDETKLSETATVLSEIAFDCIGGWLKEDLEMYSKMKAQPQDNLPGEKRVVDTELVHQSNGVVLEVVDAATILAKENAEAMVETAIENITVDNGISSSIDVVPRTKEIQVVDATPLITLQTTGETEILMTSTSVPSQESGSWHSRSSWFSQQPLKSYSEPNFSNHKLCSIVWTATDLQDSLANSLLDTTTEIFAQQGPKSMLDLGGGDLANLAWAIAKRTRCPDFSPSNNVTTLLLELLQWIAERSLALLEMRKGVEVFEQFQAPELGRLIWSLSMTLPNMSQHAVHSQTQTPDICVRQLALLSLKLADKYASRFGSEDLARITWGFLELSVLNDVLKDPSVSAALGRLVAIMEASVLRWESCQCERSSEESVAQVDESIRFASFFGRPRLALRLLEQRLDTAIDDDDESQSVESEKTRKLPLLRDLSMDPATMCKLAYGLSRTKESFPEINGAWTFTRIAVRLMSAKNGQLLKVSSAGDDVRLAYACATNQFGGHSRDFIARLYTRRLLQRLNEQLGWSEKGSVSDQLALSPEDTATLVWSLGELGTRHWASDHGVNGTAYKKLRLVTSLPFLSESQIGSLSPHSLARSLYGLVSMEMHFSTPGHILLFLHTLMSKSHAELAGVNLCELAECLAKIKATTGETDVITSAPAEHLSSLLNATGTSNEDSNSTRTTKSSDSNSAITGTVNDGIDDILKSVVQLLETISQAATKNLKSMTANEIRRILACYAGLPLQADAFINAVENEVKDRLMAAKFVTNLPESAILAATAARGSCDALADKSDDGSSRLASLRKGLRSIFLQSPDGCDKNESVGSASKLEEVADLLTETANTASLVTDHFARVTKLTNKDSGFLLASEQRGSVFELSRCEELIASYRRVDFETGKRQSRQDGGQRNGIGQQVISRIFY